VPILNYRTFLCQINADKTKMYHDLPGRVFKAEIFMAEKRFSTQLSRYGNKKQPND